MKLVSAATAANGRADWCLGGTPWFADAVFVPVGLLPRWESASSTKQFALTDRLLDLRFRVSMALHLISAHSFLGLILARWQTPASNGPDLDGARVIVGLPLVVQ